MLPLGVCRSPAGHAGLLGHQGEAGPLSGTDAMVHGHACRFGNVTPDREDWHL